MIVENAKICPPNVIFQEMKSFGICRDSLYSRLHLGEKPITEVRATFAIKMFQRSPYIRLNIGVKPDFHRPRLLRI
jgi:hypothetical protein